MKITFFNIRINIFRLFLFCKIGSKICQLSFFLNCIGSICISRKNIRQRLGTYSSGNCIRNCFFQISYRSLSITFYINTLFFSFCSIKLRYQLIKSSLLCTIIIMPDSKGNWFIWIQFYLAVWRNISYMTTGC